MVQSIISMDIKQLSELFERIKTREKKTLVAVNPADSHSLEAIAQAVKLNIVNAVFTGDSGVIIQNCIEHGIDPGLFNIISAETEEDAANAAMEEIASLQNSILMKGLLGTDTFMRAILKKENGLIPSGGILSHVSVIQNPHYHKLMIVSDVAVIPYPDIHQKAAMLRYLVDVALALGIKQPKVALIAPSEKVLPKLKSCTDAAKLMKIAEKDFYAPAVIHGPMAMDVAIDKESAQIKNIHSPVAGDADCMLFPNIDAGNVFYKMNTKLCGAEQAAVVVGARIPIVLSSRGDDVKTKLNSIALAVLLNNSEQ